MRKKFLAMYALVGALVASPIFTSCIDSEESASVTQVRNERAAQIKAAAEMQKAMDELNLALKQVELESEKAILEETKAKTEQAVLAAQLQILKNKAALDDYNNDRLSALTLEYSNALGVVAELNKKLYTRNANLTALQNGLIDAQEYIAGRTIELQNQIASQKAILETLSKAEGIDKEAIVAQVADLNAQLKVAKAEESNLKAEYGSLNVYQHMNTIEDVYKKIDVKNDSGEQLYWQLDGSQGTDETATDDNGTPNDNSDDITIVLSKVQAFELDAEGNRILENRGLDFYYFDNPTNLATIEAARELHKLSVNTNYSLLTNDANGYLILKEGEIAEFKQYVYSTYPTTIKNYKAELGTEADKEDTKAKLSDGTEVPTLYAKLALANKELADAEKVVADAGDAATDDQIKAVTDAENKVAYSKDWINDWLVMIANYEKSNEAMLAFDSYVAAFSGADYDAYKAAKDAIAANSELCTSLDNEIFAIRQTYFVNPWIYDDYDFKSDFNVVDEIANLESLIKQNEESLEEIKCALNLPDPTDNYNSWLHYFTEAEIEAFIVFAKEDIAKIEAELALRKIEADNAKAALDAYLATEEA